MGSVTAVAVVECSRIGTFGDPTWSAEQRGAAHAQEVGVSAATALAICSWDVACFFVIFIFGDMWGSGVLACAGCSWLPVLSFLLFSRSSPLRATDKTFLRACGGAAFFFGKKAFRRHNETAARATRGGGEDPGIFFAGWHRTLAVWLICIPQCTVRGMCGDNFLKWSDTSSTGSGTEEWWLRAFQ
ncbi:retrotransposon hot spot (RHS) protein [Trypanosoma cruzi]|nr:retrotransposon hot spot (RHS) protein [Trypanosoma cruzi]